MRENLTYGSMRGCWEGAHGDAYTGTKLETADTAKATPTNPAPVLYSAAAGRNVYPVILRSRAR
jgi:hypothetical protein